MWSCVSGQEAELLPLVNNFAHRPFTMLWPTDTVFNALPEKMQTWLYHKDHRDKLAAYLKVHMIRDMKVKAAAKRLKPTVFLFKSAKCLSLVQTMHQSWTCQCDGYFGTPERGL